VRVLVVNAGSSSVKLSVVGDGERTLLSETLAAPDGAAAAVRRFVEQAQSIDAVGHRLVHGGERFTGPVVVDAGVREELDLLSALAPLHMPPALALLDSLAQVVSVPQVACFDTAFHATLPEASRVYALPQRWRERGVRRYGFHGLSCAWSLRRVAELQRQEARSLQLVVAHLGAGASVTAIRGGVSVDTSMGFTPLEGLVMATRSGSVDPGALMWLMRSQAVSAAELDHALEHESGLMALAGTGDMRTLEQRAEQHDQAAVHAQDAYAHRAAACIASVAASLERLDALVFTGGAGEHSHAMRKRICARLSILGLPARLRQRVADTDGAVSEPGESPSVLVVTAREDLEIAREMRRLLEDAPPAGARPSPPA
jgi:acetate kinase